MNGRHRCPGGCGRNVRDAMFACYDCWGALPRADQQAIYATATLPLTSAERQQALASAVAAYLQRAQRSHGSLTVPPEWAAVGPV